MVWSNTKNDNRSSGTFQLWCVLQFNSLIFHKYCVQLKNHYNKSILSSQRNMIFMLQYTFHKSQYSAKRNNNIIIVYDVILEWNGKEEFSFFHSTYTCYVYLICHDGKSFSFFFIFLIDNIHNIVYTSLL